MSWDANDVALLKKLWAEGHSAGQISNRLGLSRNAVSAKLKRMGQKRGRKPPTANPKIVSVPKPKPALVAACAQPVAGMVDVGLYRGRVRAQACHEAAEADGEATGGIHQGAALRHAGRCGEEHGQQEAARLKHEIVP